MHNSSEITKFPRENVKKYSYRQRHCYLLFSFKRVHEISHACYCFLPLHQTHQLLHLSTHLEKLGNQLAHLIVENQNDNLVSSMVWYTKHCRLSKTGDIIRIEQNLTSCSVFPDSSATLILLSRDSASNSGFSLSSMHPRKHTIKHPCPQHKHPIRLHICS